MARVPRHANRKGMTAALDLVEDTLNKLQEKAQQQQAQYKDAETNTTPLQPEVPKTRQRKRRETSVLINHKLNARPGKSTQRKHRKSSFRSDSLSSRNDTSIESCRDSRTPRSIHQNVKKTGKSREYEYYSRSESVQVIDSQRDLSKNATSHSSKKRSKRNESLESSSDESRRKHKTQPPQNSRPRQRSCEVALDSGISHNWPDGDAQGKGRNRQRQRPRSHKELASHQSYAKPTLTSKFRDELLSRREKDEKENITPFIPCGSKSKSYHVGVIVQQELGRINNMTTKDLENLRVLSPSSQEPVADRSDSEEVTEEMVRRALSNIHQHIALVKRHTSKN